MGWSNIEGLQRIDKFELGTNECANLIGHHRASFGAQPIGELRGMKEDELMIREDGKVERANCGAEEF
jgi:hypothetical protein